MRLTFPSLVCMAVLAVLVACNSEAGAPTTPVPATTALKTPTPPEGTAAASPSATSTLPATRTPAPFTVAPGVEGLIPPIVQRVTDAISAGDVEEVLHLIQMTQAPCTERGGMGGPPKCWIGNRSYKAGNVYPEGTIVEAFPLSGCELGWYDREALERIIPPDLERTHDLYAVVRLAKPLFESTEAYYPSAAYAAVFTDIENPDRSRVFAIGDAGVTFIDTPCVLSAADTIAEHPRYRDAEVVAYGPAFDQ